MSGLVLAYNPPLLDILPMYVLFLVASPLLLEYGARRGWGVLLSLSAVLWLFAQYGGGRHVYESVAAVVGWPVPYGATGAFSFLGWQLLWLVGLRAGANRGTAASAPSTVGGSWSGPGIVILLSVAAVFFVWRHVVGQIPFESDATLNALFDKWHLGPLRLLDFAVLALIAVRCRRTLAAWAEHSPIATMGRTSLVVFSAQLVICLAVLALVGDAARLHLSIFETTLVLGALLVLYGVARASLDGGEFLRGHRRALAERVSARAAR